MAARRFSLRARVSSDNPEAVRPVLERQIPGGSIERAPNAKEFTVEGELNGTTARDLNRVLLSALRQVEKRTRIRSEWTCDGTTERFFDYVPKGNRVGPSDHESSA